MTETRLLILNYAEPRLSSEQQEANEALRAIQALCAKACTENRLQMDFRQTDDPAQLIAWISDLASNADALIINPGIGFQDTDSLTSAVNEFTQLNKPFTEIHLINIFSPQPQQAKPLDISNCQTGFISGLGINGYTLAINSMANKLEAGN